LMFFIASTRFQRRRRPHVGNESGFHIVYRFSVRRVLSVGTKDCNHYRFQAQCGAIRQAVLAPPFLGFEHFDFGRLPRGIRPDVAQSSLQLLVSAAPLHARSMVLLT
jgi:hypothetical protein